MRTHSLSPTAPSILSLAVEPVPLSMRLGNLIHWQDSHTEFVLPRCVSLDPRQHFPIYLVRLKLMENQPRRWFGTWLFRRGQTLEGSRLRIRPCKDKLKSGGSKVSRRVGDAGDVLT